MTACLARRAAALVAATLLVAIAFVVAQFQRRPSLQPHQGLLLPEAEAAAAGVRVRFAGVSTLLFDDGETAWMTDGFFSRPGVLQTAFGRIGPDAERIDHGLRQLGVTKLAAVVPLHSHYDHAMDAPVVAQRTGAMLVGGDSTLNVGRGLGLPADRMRAVPPGDTLQLGKFNLRFIASRHSPTPYSSGHDHEPITSPLVPPRHVTAWREGEVWSLVVNHESGASFLVHGSAGYIPGMLAGVRADTVFLGVGTLGKKDDAYRAAYWQETVKAVGARRVIPIHWDDFTLGLDQPLQATPYLLDDVDLVLRDLATRTRQDGTELRMPPLFVPFRP